jgi:hypothetical protein
MLNRVALVLALLAYGTCAQAQQRLSTLNLTCGQAQQVVLARGAVVLSTGAHTYDRYVRDQSFCEFNETIKLAVVPSRDTPQCPVGYRCSTNLDFFSSE